MQPTNHPSVLPVLACGLLDRATLALMKLCVSGTTRREESFNSLSSIRVLTWQRHLGLPVVRQDEVESLVNVCKDTYTLLAMRERHCFASVKEQKAVGILIFPQIKHLKTTHR
jgi:hypothetical protein